MYEVNENLSIYEDILQGLRSPESIVKQWIESYKANKQQALVKLLQLIIDSSGCRGKITDAYDDYTAVIRNLTNEFNENVSDYPLSLSSVKWRKFTGKFCDFLTVLVRSCQNCIIYDGYMMTNLTSLLAGLSDSQVRAFRHTSTLASMKVITVLVEVLVSVSSKYSVSRRQYQYETNKSIKRRISYRIEHLSSLNKELEENIDCLNEFITFGFRAIFVNRYRDIMPEIRETCIYEIGIWMKKAPEKFLDDLHLKYIGWSLNDKVSGVRIKALKALMPLYDTGKHVGSLELFTLKFKDRIVSMTSDIDINVAVETIKLLQLMFTNFFYVFVHNDFLEIFKIIYSSVSVVARKAGEFFCMMLDSKIKNNDSPEQNIGIPPNLNAQFVKHLLKFHMDEKLHKHLSYLVDSLLDHSDAMKDWKCMTNLLLDLDKNLETLTRSEEKILIEMMVCCIAQTYTRTPPIGRQVKKIQTPKMLKQVGDNIHKLTKHFIVVLPDLLDKYGADSESLCALLGIPQYFDMTILALYPSFIENLESLLDKLPNIIKISHNKDILEKCCNILNYLCNENYRISIKAEICKNMIIDNIVNKLKSSLSELRQVVDEQLDDDFKFSLTDNFLKISIFYSMFDLSRLDLWDDLFIFMNEIIITKISVPDDCIKNCIVACYFNLIWDLKNYEDNLETASVIEFKFKSRFLPFIDLLKRFIAHPMSKICSQESYIIFCDLLIIMKNCLKSVGLPSMPIGNTQKILQTYVENTVFSENESSDDFEASVEALYKKRVVLTSYCKLFVYSILPVFFLSHLLKHYVTSFCNFGDILKSTIIRAKGVSNVDCARAIINALIMMFEDSVTELVVENNKYFMNNISDMKEVAKQLSPLIITNEEREMTAIYTLHTDGITFALQNSAVNQEGKVLTSYNVLFFEILVEFSYKLSKRNKVNILNFFNNKLCFENKLNMSQELEPLLLYKNSLGLSHGNGKN